MGERVEENKNIYISQSVYKEIHKFTNNKTTNESGGMLLGEIIEEFGKTNIVISGFVEAKFCEATPTTLKFTHETWDYVHGEIERKHNGKKIVGWIHTHPDFGIFLSEYDKFIHQNFFSEDYQVAYVVDPIQKIEGFYFWINGTIERCKGFYLYDKNGRQINVDTGSAVSEKETENVPASGKKNFLIAALSIAVVFLLISNFSMNRQLNELKEKQQNIINETNQVFLYLQQIINTQSTEIQNMKDTLKKYGIVVKTQTNTPKNNASVNNEKEKTVENEKTETNNVEGDIVENE